LLKHFKNERAKLVNSLPGLGIFIGSLSYVHNLHQDHIFHQTRKI